MEIISLRMHDLVITFKMMNTFW